MHEVWIKKSGGYCSYVIEVVDQMNNGEVVEKTERLNSYSEARMNAKQYSAKYNNAPIVKFDEWGNIMKR